MEKEEEGLLRPTLPPSSLFLVVNDTAEEEGEIGRRLILGVCNAKKCFEMLSAPWIFSEKRG